MKFINEMNWGGEGFPSYDGFLNTAVATPTPAAPPAAASSAGKTSAETASPAADGKAVDPSTTTQSNDENLRVLRESHTQLQKFSKLGDLDTVSAHVQQVVKLSKEAETLGKGLNYNIEDVRKAFKSDPVNTLAALRQEAAKAQKDQQAKGAGDPEQRTRQLVKEALRPFEEKAAADEARTTYSFIDSTTTNFIKADFPDSPTEVSNLVFDMTATILQNAIEGNGDVRSALREGNSAEIKKAYLEAKDIFNRAFTAYQKHLTKGGNTNNDSNDGAQKTKVTLDDILEGNDKAKQVIRAYR